MILDDAEAGLAKALAHSLGEVAGACQQQESTCTPETDSGPCRLCCHESLGNGKTGQIAQAASPLMRNDDFCEAACCVAAGTCQHSQCFRLAWKEASGNLKALAHGGKGLCQHAPPAWVVIKDAAKSAAYLWTAQTSIHWVEIVHNELWSAVQVQSIDLWTMPAGSGH